jgi:hypothetical protein
MPRPNLVVLVLAAFVALWAIGCHKERLPELPGETDVTISEITIESATSEPLELAYGDSSV